LIYKEPFTYKIVPQSDYDELMAEYYGMFEDKSSKDSTFPFGQQWTPVQTHIPHDLPPASPDKPALELQVGGDHYKSMKIQPMEYILANNLGWAEGNVIKYVTRHRSKGGKQDLEKAIHMLQLIIDLEYKDA
jgi:hypothetical protein